MLHTIDLTRRKEPTGLRLAAAILEGPTFVVFPFARDSERDGEDSRVDRALWKGDLADVNRGSFHPSSSPSAATF